MAVPLHLDGSEIGSEHALHDAVARWSGFAGYGRNLDALWDIVTGIVEPPIAIRWTNAAISRAGMGERFDRIVDLFRDAEEELGADDFSLAIEP